jgi:hypothetical protein
MNTPERDKLIQIALQCEGMGANIDIDQFANLMGLIGSWKYGLKTPFSCKLVNGKWITTGVSTCALVAEGIWNSAGVDMPSNWRPYAGGALSRAVKFAEQQTPRSAWQTPIDGLRPEPGDYLIIGHGTSEHALTVVDWEDDSSGNDVCVSIDGGQVDAKSGLQCIKKCKRPWTWNSLGSRAVQGWICIDLLPWKGDIK